jgi:hypothetical protein
MKLNEIPQDKSALANFTKEVCYAKNDENKYQTTLSSGWEVKNEALNEAWKDIYEDRELAKKQVKEGKYSPIYYYMILNLMDVGILSDYTGFWKINIKRHFKPTVFAKLTDKKLNVYAKVFKISVTELKNTEL